LVRLIEKRVGRSISDVFKRDGEPYFRKVESEVLEQSAKQQDQIIATGGGIVVNPANCETMKKTGDVIYLRADLEVLWQRVKGNKRRPLLEKPNPKQSLADYCLGCYTNRNLPQRVEMIETYMKEYEADGFLINSIKSCNSFSAGQLLIMREIEDRTGKPAAFVESDLVDPRYFSKANIKNRLESYFQMIDQKRQGAATVAA